MPVWAVLLLCFAGLILVYLVACLLAARIVFGQNVSRQSEEEIARREKKNARAKQRALGGDFEKLQAYREAHADFAKLPAERWETTAFDGVRLYGYLIPAKTPPDTTVVCVHGYHGGPYRDMSVMGDFFRRMGCNVFLPVDRAHGESGGAYIGYGILDHRDVLEWLEALNRRFPQGKLVLYGVSMGGAAVMMTSNHERLPRNVRCIVEDCGFTSPWEEFGSQIVRYHIPAFPLLRFIDALCRRRAGYGLRDRSARECVRKSRVPILFLHGGADDFVPTWMGKSCYEACGSEKQLKIFPGAAHTLSHFYHPEEYEAIVTEFLRKYLR